VLPWRQVPGIECISHSPYRLFQCTHIPVLILLLILL
jgi:hypothetical protein